MLSGKRKVPINVSSNRCFCEGPWEIAPPERVVVRMEVAGSDRLFVTGNKRVLRKNYVRTLWTPTRTDAPQFSAPPE